MLSRVVDSSSSSCQRHFADSAGMRRRRMWRRVTASQQHSPGIYNKQSSYRWQPARWLRRT